MNFRFFMMTMLLIFLYACGSSSNKIGYKESELLPIDDIKVITVPIITADDLSE